MRFNFHRFPYEIFIEKYTKFGAQRVKSSRSKCDISTQLTYRGMNTADMNKLFALPRPVCFVGYTYSEQLNSL